jgi:hypothetical protein
MPTAAITKESRNRQLALTFGFATPKVITSTHGQVSGPQGHPADNYELTCFGQGSGNSGLCA